VDVVALQETVCRAEAAAVAVKAQVHRVDMASGELPDDLIPAAAVEAGGMQQQNRIAMPGPFDASQFDVANIQAEFAKFLHQYCSPMDESMGWHHCVNPAAT